VAQHLARDANSPRDSEELPEKLTSAVTNVAGENAHQDGAERRANSFTEAGGATVAALLHLLRLVSAELVLTRGSDIGLFEQAVRAKIGEFTSPTANREAREAGLTQARYLVEQVLTQIRAQAELKKSLSVAAATPAAASASQAGGATSNPIPSKLLN
jgi:hypothetical protein